MEKHKSKKVKIKESQFEIIVRTASDQWELNKFAIPLGSLLLNV